MWETSMSGLQSLVRESTPSAYAYICEKDGNTLIDQVGEASHLSFLLYSVPRMLIVWFLWLQMNELACFASGMLALGSSGFDPQKAKTILSLSEEVIVCLCHLQKL